VIRQFTYSTPGQGLHPITEKLEAIVRSSGIEEGLCTVFLPHTSASLIIQENADPTARRDLERWMVRMVPEGDPHYTHVSEGPDDMPSHIRSVLTQVSIGIPIVYGALALGQWQGVYLWEHRRKPHTRSIVVHLRED
jgi:secondary thiamine-phosphate synthase enzyme